MGLFDFFKSTMKHVIKKEPFNAEVMTQERKWHCGYCGITLRDDDWMCPACGGTPIDQNGKSK